MKNSQYTFFILVISWFFFIIGCSVTAAYMKVSTQFDTQTKKTEAAQASKLSESELYDSKYEVGKTEAKLSDFMKKYYEYLEEGNREELLKMVEDTECFFSFQKLRNMTLYIEKYNNITCYIKNGEDTHSYIVFVSYDAKFHDIAQTVPGVSQYYVIDEDGEFKIYNNKDHLSIEAQKAMEVSLRLKDIKALIEDTRQRYEAVIATNKELEEFFEE